MQFNNQLTLAPWQIKSAIDSIFNWLTSAYGYMGKEILFAVIFLLIKMKNLQKLKFKCVNTNGAKTAKYNTSYLLLCHSGSQVTHNYFFFPVLFVITIVNLSTV